MEYGDIWSLCTALSIAAAIGLGHLHGLQRGYARAHLVGFYLVITGCGFAGARLGFGLVHWTHYQAHPWELLAWTPGLVIQGALLGGLLGAVPYVHWLGYDKWRAADDAVPFVTLGQAVGRMGCFLGGCCYGEPTSLPWGCRFPEIGDGLTPRHPTQIYEAVGLLGLFGVLYRITRGEHGDGRVAALYLALTGLLRFLVELLRADNLDSFYLGLSVYQWMSVGFMLASLVLWRNLPRSTRAALE